MQLSTLSIKYDKVLIAQYKAEHAPKQGKWNNHRQPAISRNSDSSVLNTNTHSLPLYLSRTMLLLSDANGTPPHLLRIHPLPTPNIVSQTIHPKTTDAP